MWTATEEDAGSGNGNGVASSSSSITRKHPDGRKKWEQQRNNVEKQGTNDGDLIPAENEFLDEQEDDASKSERSSAVEKKKKFLDDKTQAETERRGTTGFSHHEQDVGDPKRESSRGSGRGGKNDFLGDEEEEHDFGPKTGSSSSALQKNNAGPRLPPGRHQSGTQGHTYEDKMTEGSRAADTPGDVMRPPVRGDEDDDPAAQSALQAAQSALQDDEVQQGARGPREDHAVHNEEESKFTLQNKKEDSTDIPQQAVTPPQPAGGEPAEKAESRTSDAETGEDRLLSSGGNYGDDLNHHHLQGRAAITEQVTTTASQVPPPPEQDDAVNNKNEVNTTSSVPVLLSSSGATTTTTTTTGPSITTVPVLEDSQPDAPSIAVPTTPAVADGNSVLAATAMTSTAVVVKTSSTTTASTSTTSTTTVSSSSTDEELWTKDEAAKLESQNVRHPGAAAGDKKPGVLNKEEPRRMLTRREPKSNATDVEEQVGKLQQTTNTASSTGVLSSHTNTTNTASEIFRSTNSTTSTPGGGGKGDPGVKSLEQKAALKGKDDQGKDEQASSVMEEKAVRPSVTPLHPVTGWPEPSPLARAVKAQIGDRASTTSGASGGSPSSHASSPFAAIAKAVADTIGGMTATAGVAGMRSRAARAWRARRARIGRFAPTAAGGSGGRGGDPPNKDNVALLAGDEGDPGKDAGLLEQLKKKLFEALEQFLKTMKHRNHVQHWLLKGGTLDWSLFEQFAQGVLQDIFDEFAKRMNEERITGDYVANVVPEDVKQRWKEIIIEKYHEIQIFVANADQCHGVWVWEPLADMLV